MRWYTKPYPRIGNTRILLKFLWLPKYCDNQYRWLEFARWEEVYTRSFSKDNSYWAARKWIGR